MSGVSPASDFFPFLAAWFPRETRRDRGEDRDGGRSRSRRDHREYRSRETDRYRETSRHRAASRYHDSYRPRGADARRSRSPAPRSPGERGHRERGSDSRTRVRLRSLSSRDEGRREGAHARGNPNLIPLANPRYPRSTPAAAAPTPEIVPAPVAPRTEMPPPAGSRAERPPVGPRSEKCSHMTKWTASPARAQPVVCRICGTRGYVLTLFHSPLFYMLTCLEPEFSASAPPAATNAALHARTGSRTATANSNPDMVRLQARLQVAARLLSSEGLHHTARTTIVDGGEDHGR
ncbi:hypothetical protein IQ07DRAFT_581952 [Pyrenochaeta sp. DS3sAY3a]|nr:hypothetical protein IQ07DRAFT_581952 [Pyrenochaeta sp. DS3sAY3a]